MSGSASETPSPVLLVVTDEAQRIDEIRVAFSDAGDGLDLEFCRSLSEARRAVEASNPTLVVLAESVARGSGFDLLSFTRRDSAAVPMLVAVDESSGLAVQSDVGRGEIGCITWSELLPGSLPMLMRLAGTCTHNLSARLQSERRMRIQNRAIDSVSNGILITDPNQKDNPIVYCNQSFCRMTGYEQHEILGRNCRLLQNDDRDQGGVREVRKAIRERRPCHVVVRNYRKDGQMFWNELTISPVFDERERLINFIGIQNDITARTTAQMALQQASDRLRYLVKAGPTMIYTCEPDGQFKTTFMSGNVATHLGYQPQQFLEEPEFWLDRVHPDDRNRVLDELVGLSEEGHHKTEYRFQHKDGHYCWMLDEMRLTTGTDGQPAEIVGYWIDISERKRADERLHQMESEIENAARINTAAELGAGVAHELNQPLSAIVNYASVCLSQLKRSGGDYRKQIVGHVEQIHDMALQSAELMRSLRAIGQQRPRRREIVPLGALIRSTIEILVFDLRREGISLTLNTPDCEVLVDVDPVQIPQVILNLVRNGIEAFRSTERQCCELSISLHVDEDSMCAIVQVSDNGCGIAPDLIDRVFEPFVSGKPDGMGIGLSISSRIIESHRGTMKAWNNDSGGATFQISLPVQSEGN